MKPDINETLGETTKATIVVCDGLCIAIMNDSIRFDSLATDLLKEMSIIGSPSGSILFARGKPHGILESKRIELASSGISIKYSPVDDLLLGARQICDKFLQHSFFNQEQYEKNYKAP